MNLDPDFAEAVRNLAVNETVELGEAGEHEVIDDPGNFALQAINGQVQDYEIEDYINNAENNGTFGAADARRAWNDLK